MTNNIILADDVVAELRDAYHRQKDSLRLRIEEFRRVPETEYFYELCYCLMTPQSSAVQCDKVTRELARSGFSSHPFDPEPLLRSFEGGYVRFHRTKARRLLALVDRFDDIRTVLASAQPTKSLRTELARRVDGLGMKEASHFLRNIGRTDLTIIDRHILRNLIRFGVLQQWPKSISQRRYLEIELMFEACAEALAIPADELDLLLWSRETGFVLK